jgi:hypothetical protein
MNKNCPTETEALNLKNQCKHSRDLYRFNSTFTSSVRKCFYFKDLPPDIKTRRLAASQQMRDMDHTPSNNFTFICFTNPTTTRTATPPTHPTPTPPECGHTNTTQTTIISPPEQQYQLPPADMSIATNTTTLLDSADIDDDMASRTFINSLTAKSVLV